MSWRQPTKLRKRTKPFASFTNDMKNHLLAIRSLAQGEGDAAAYIDSIVGQMEVCDELVSTGLALSGCLSDPEDIQPQTNRRELPYRAVFGTAGSDYPNRHDLHYW